MVVKFILVIFEVDNFDCHWLIYMNSMITCELIFAPVHMRGKPQSNLICEGITIILNLFQGDHVWRSCFCG